MGWGERDGKLSVLVVPLNAVGILGEAVPRMWRWVNPKFNVEYVEFKMIL